MLYMTLEAWHYFFPLSWILIRGMMVLFYFPHVTGSPWAYPSTDRLFLQLCLNNSVATHPGVVQTSLLFISSILFCFSSSTSHIYPHLLLCYGFDLNRCGLYLEHFSLWKTQHLDVVLTSTHSGMHPLMFASIVILSYFHRNALVLFCFVFCRNPRHRGSQKCVIILVSLLPDAWR